MTNETINTAPLPDEAIEPQQEDADLLCEQWVSWSRTRRLYGPRPKLGGALGRIACGASNPMRTYRDDAINSPALQAFHIAYTCQPDALDRRVFDAYYVHRIRPVKAAAALMGISVRHFYRLLTDFRERVRLAARAVEAAQAELPQAAEEKPS